MINVRDAEKIILNEALNPFKDEKLHFSKCFNRILKESITSDREQPPFDRVAMDGIAIDYEAFSSGISSFKIQDIQKAGMSPLILIDKSNCIEIMTGAVLPIGCNCVIKIEDLDIENGYANLKKDIKVEPNQNIHFKGSDYAQGIEVLKIGTKILPVHTALLASVGKEFVSVNSFPKIAIVSTGDELVDVNSEILPHQIRMSNSYGIQASLMSKGYEYEKIKIFHLKDIKELLLDEISKILKEFDVVILSGGVSMGKFDFIPQVMNELGVKTIFHKIKQKPGKPFWLGKTSDSKLVFGLPGNPVSAMVCFYRYIIPYLDKKSGFEKQSEKVFLSEDFKHSHNLTSFVPVKIYLENGMRKAFILKNNGSGDYYSISKSHGFIEIPEEDKFLEKGSSVSFFSWEV